MAKRYRKLDPRIWTDEKFYPLEADQKLLTLYAFTQSNRVGLFVFSPGKACEDINVGYTYDSDAVRCLTTALNWGWDEGKRLLWIPTWWRYNAPQNANHMRGCIEDLHDVPTSEFDAKLYENTGDLEQVKWDAVSVFQDALTARYPTRFRKEDDFGTRREHKRTRSESKTKPRRPSKKGGGR